MPNDFDKNNEFDDDDLGRDSNANYDFTNRNVRNSNDDFNRKNTNEVFDETREQMIQTKKKYEDLISSGKIKDQKKKEQI